MFHSDRRTCMKLCGAVYILAIYHKHLPRRGSSTIGRTSSWMCMSAEGRAGEDRHEQHKHLLTSKALLPEAGTFVTGANLDFTGRVVGRKCRGLEQNTSVISKHVNYRAGGPCCLHTNVPQAW